MGVPRSRPIIYRGDNKMLKTCTKCGIEKSINCFSERKDTQSGYRATCKECTHKQRSAYRGGTKAFKTCRVCGIDKPFEDFYKNWRCQDGYMSLCKECNKNLCSKHYQDTKDQTLIKKHIDRETNKEKFLLRERKYRRANKEKRSQYHREYRLTENGKIRHRQGSHIRRAKTKNSETKLSVEQWHKILKLQDNKCNICGKRFTEKHPPTIDHIIPLFHDGGSEFENIQALCLSCNSKKQAKLDKRFIQTWVYNGTKN